MDREKKREEWKSLNPIYNYILVQRWPYLDKAADEAAISKKIRIDSVTEQQKKPYVRFQFPSFPH